MTCPECGGDTAVIDSRPKGAHVERRRACLVCGCRFTTTEILWVRRDGRKRR